MKKHSALTRASGILLVLTLVTSCFVGGTFAKYVTDGEGTDTARVAKWGVKVEVTGDGFKTSYGKDDFESTLLTDTVISSNLDENEKVIAPGTQNEFGSIRITGKPEVGVKVKTEAIVTLANEDYWTVDGKFYCPLVFNIGGHIIEGLDYQDRNSGGYNSLVSDLKKAIESTVSGEYEPNTDLATIGQWEAYDPTTDYGPEDEDREKAVFCDYDQDGYVDFMWAWPFEKGKDGTTITWYENWSNPSKNVTSTLDGDYDDELDTLLGNKIANGDAPDISITITTTVTQVD